MRGCEVIGNDWLAMWLIFICLWAGIVLILLKLMDNKEKLDKIAAKLGIKDEE